jgi:uncharacterized protein YecE (DUF72 family)
MAKLFVGLSGYSYKEWQGEGLLYPPGLSAKGFFKFYSERFNALEGVGMWYALPSKTSVAEWVESSPAGFKVSPKVHKTVTHMTRLKPTGFPVMQEMLKALEPLEKAGKMGPILVQLPPNLKRDDALLNAFLAEVPHRPSLRYSFDFRNTSWHDPEVEENLRAHNISWVAEETDEAPAERRDTADHIYLRLRKLEYTDDELKAWAVFLSEKLALGKDCYVYCRHKDTVAPWKWGDRIAELTQGSD